MEYKTLMKNLSPQRQNCQFNIHEVILCFLFRLVLFVFVDSDRPKTDLEELGNLVPLNFRSRWLNLKWEYHALLSRFQPFLLIFWISGPMFIWSMKSLKDDKKETFSMNFHLKVARLWTGHLVTKNNGSIELADFFSQDRKKIRL